MGLFRWLEKRKTNRAENIRKIKQAEYDKGFSTATTFAEEHGPIRAEEVYGLINNNRNHPNSWDDGWADGIIAACNKKLGG